MTLLLDGAALRGWRGARRVEASADELARYAAVCGDQRPERLAGAVASPVWTCVPFGTVAREFVAEFLGDAVTGRLVHLASTIDVDAPVRAATPIEVTAEAVGLRHTSQGAVVDLAGTARTPDGTRLARQSGAFLVAGCATKNPFPTSSVPTPDRLAESAPAGSAAAWAGLAGSAPAGSALAGSGAAGSGAAGSGAAGSGAAGSALAGSAPAGSAAASAGVAGSAVASAGLAGSAPAGSAGGAPPAAGSPGAAGDERVVSVAVARDQAVRYAEVSGDRNPIHLDAAAARRIGFAAPILHGMCTLALTCAALERALGREARSLHAEFARPVFNGDALSVRWRPTADGAEFDVLNRRRRPVLRAGNVVAHAPATTSH